MDQEDQFFSKDYIVIPQAEMMVGRSNKRLKTAEVGATVRIKVPKLDRGPFDSDYQNMLGSQHWFVAIICHPGSTDFERSSYDKPDEENMKGS